jgi:hypothetical protein
MENEKLFTPEETITAPETKDELFINSIIEAHKNEKAEEPEEEEPEETETEETETTEPNKVQSIKGEPEPTEKEALTSLIDTDIIVVLGDVMLSRLFYFVFKKFLKRDVNIQDFSLTPEESKAISKLLKKYAETKEIKISPVNALIFGIVSVYASKGIIAFSMDKTETAKPQSIKEETTGKPTGKRGRPRKIKEVEA